MAAGGPPPISRTRIKWPEFGSRILRLDRVGRHKKNFDFAPSAWKLSIVFFLKRKKTISRFQWSICDPFYWNLRDADGELQVHSNRFRWWPLGGKEMKLLSNWIVPGKVFFAFHRVRWAEKAQHERHRDQTKTKGRQAERPTPKNRPRCPAAAAAAGPAALSTAELFPKWRAVESTTSRRNWPARIDRTPNSNSNKNNALLSHGRTALFVDTADAAMASAVATGRRARLRRRISRRKLAPDAVTVVGRRDRRHRRRKSVVKQRQKRECSEWICADLTAPAPLCPDTPPYRHCLGAVRRPSESNRRRRCHVEIFPTRLSNPVKNKTNKKPAPEPSPNDRFGPWTSKPRVNDRVQRMIWNCKVFSFIATRNPFLRPSTQTVWRARVVFRMYRIVRNGNYQYSLHPTNFRPKKKANSIPLRVFNSRRLLSALQLKVSPIGILRSILVICETVLFP